MLTPDFSSPLGCWPLERYHLSSKLSLFGGNHPNWGYFMLFIYIIIYICMKSGFDILLLAYMYHRHHKLPTVFFFVVWAIFGSGISQLATIATGGYSPITLNMKPMAEDGIYPHHFLLGKCWLSHELDVQCSEKPSGEIAQLLHRTTPRSPHVWGARAEYHQPTGTWCVGHRSDKEYKEFGNAP